MSIFSKLFRTTDERQIDRIEKESRTEARRQTGPLAALLKTITTTAEKSTQDIEPWIVASDEKKHHEMKMIAFCEFEFFLLHLMLREACLVMTYTERNYLLKHVLKAVASVSADYSFSGLPEDLKKRMVREFRANTQKAENQYAMCAPDSLVGASEEERTRTRVTLFRTLAENIASAIGRERDSEVESKILTVALRQFQHLNFVKLVSDFKKDSMELPD